MNKNLTSFFKIFSSKTYRRKFSLFFFLIFLSISQNVYSQLDNADWADGIVGCVEDALLYPGVAVVTCGVVADVPQGDRYVMAFMALNNSVPANRAEITNMDSVVHHTDWHIDNMGNVFGVAIDNSTATSYVSASSNYGSAFGFLGNNAAILNYGAIGGSPANELAAAGSVYRIDPITGAATVFTSLPQQSTTLQHWDCEANSQSTTRTNTGVGLGNIAYDEINDQFFITNVEDGRIYRVDNAGTILDSYDPLIYDPGTVGIHDIEDIPYGIAVEPGSSRVFFGMVSDPGPGPAGAQAAPGNPGIYSIDLDANGAFIGTVDNTVLPAGVPNNYVGTELLHNTIATSLPGGAFSYTTHSVYFISDLSFAPDGNLLVGVRVGCQGSWHSSYNHWAETDVIALNAGNNLYDSTPFEYDISVTGDAGNDDSYGGVAYYNQRDAGCEVDYLASSADILTEPGPHGIAIWNSTTFNAPVSPLGAFSYGVLTTGDPKGVGGDVEVMQACYSCDITGPTNACEGVDITLTYAAPITCDPNAILQWVVTGDAVINGADDQVSVTITPGTTDFSASIISPMIIDRCDFDVTVNAATPTVMTSDTTICGQAIGTLNVVDLNSLISTGTTGTWADTDASGGLAGTVFTASAADVGSSYTFTYTITGAGPAGSPCDDRSFEVEVTVEDCVFDLALTKVINTTATPGPFTAGSVVQFSITVYNQGTLEAFDIDVADYSPTGLSVPTLVAGQTGVTQNSPGDFTVDSVNANSSYTFEVEATIDANFLGSSLINDAEITGGGIEDNGTDIPDADSTPGDNATPNDTNNDNDIADTGGGDDQDPAEIIVECEEVSGVAFFDANNDGCQSGANEVGVEGMEASIFECDAAGNPVGGALATVSTAADGSYAFGPTETGDGQLCLDPTKTYTISFGFPADGSLDNLNFSTGDPVASGCDGTDSADDSAANDGTTGCVDPGADTDDEHIDIGLYECEEVSGVAFLDSNNDGCQSGASEVGVEGMEASIFECDAAGAPTGTALGTVSTGADGSYAFGPDETGAGMVCLDPAKTYTVSFGFPADGSLDDLNYSTGDPVASGCDGTDSADDSVANDGTTGCVDPSADTDDEHIDIGLYPCEEIGGIVFLDDNNDGCQSGADETGVAGMEVSLFECDAAGNPSGTALTSAVSAADGTYAFGPDETGSSMICLDPAKTYTVSFSFPTDGSLDGFFFSSGDPVAAGCDGADSADDSAANDGTTACFDPSDPATGDDGDEHIDIGIYPCLVKTDVIAAGSGSDCIVPGGTPVYRNIVTDDSEILPPGYQILYILVDASGNIVVTNIQSFYDVPVAGSFMAYSVAYDPSEYDVSTATTLADISANLSCFDISDPEPISVEVCCLAYSGWMTDGSVTGCAGGGNVATVTGVQNSGTIPADAALVYLLTDASTNIILDYSTSPSFQVSNPGNYVIHPFVYTVSEYDPANIPFGNMTIFTLNSSMFNNERCYSLNIPGVDVEVEDCCSQDLYLPGVGISVPVDHYERNGIISSDGLIDNGPTDFDAGIEILMMPGFEVVLGVEFHAYIDGCN